MSSDAAKAEQLSNRRARALPAMAAAFIAQQATFFAGAGQGERTVDHVQTGAWILLSTVLLLALATGGGWVYSRKVRELANDESTRAFRAESMQFAFVVSMATAILLYALSLIEQITAREAIHIILTVGIASALLRLAMLERRASRFG